MRKVSASIAALLACCAMPGTAYADLPRPNIERAVQADPLIYDEQLGSLDGNGRFMLDLEGSNLGPDDTAHPGGFRGGYVHIWVRRVSAANQAGAWIACDEGDCIVYGSTSKRAIHLGLNPGLIAEPGSHLQAKVWVSFTATNAQDPAGSGVMSSQWSPIFTVDRAQAGVAKPAAVAHPPQITRIAPSDFFYFPGQAIDWTVSAYARNACGNGFYAVFGGDGSPVAPRQCTNVDIDGSRLPDGLIRVVVELPLSLRHTGNYSLVLHNPDGDSNAVPIAVRPPAMTPIQRVGAPGSPGGQQTTPSNTAQPAPAPQTAPPPRVILTPIRKPG